MSAIRTVQVVTTIRRWTFLALHLVLLTAVDWMEEGLFPLGRAYDDPETLEEERRLFYVGITRAEDKLSLSWARQRRRAGDFNYNTLSSFVDAVPEELLEERRSNGG